MGEMLRFGFELKGAERETQRGIYDLSLSEQQGVHQKQSAVPSGNKEVGLSSFIPVVPRGPPSNHGPEGEPRR